MTESRKKEIQSIKHQYKGKLSLVIPLYNETDRLDRLADGLQRFDEVWQSPYEVVLVNDGSADETFQRLEERYGTASTDRLSYVLIDVQPNQGKGNALIEGMQKATGDHILTLDADMAAYPEELLKWLDRLPEKNFPEDKIIVGSREHKESEITGNPRRRLLGLIFNFFIRWWTSLLLKDTQCGFKLYPRAIGQYLFKKLRTKGWAHDVELLYRANLHGIEILGLPLVWEEVENSKISVGSDGIKMAIASFWISITVRLDYFLRSPLQEFRQPIKGLIRSESPLFRLAFAALALILLPLLLLIPPNYNLKGATETTMAVWTENMANMSGFSAAGISESLIILCALISIFFAGLAARQLSKGWTTGFLTMLFVLFLLLSQFSYKLISLPEDFLFTAVSSFALFQVLRFIGQLPLISFKATLLSSLGIGLLLLSWCGNAYGLGAISLLILLAWALHTITWKVWTKASTGQSAEVGLLILFCIMNYL